MNRPFCLLVVLWISMILQVVPAISQVKSDSSSGFCIEYRQNSEGEVCWIRYYGPARSTFNPSSKKDFGSRLKWHQMGSLTEIELKHCDVTRPLLEYISSLSSIDHLTIGTEPDEICFDTGALDALKEMKSLKSLFLVNKAFSQGELEFLSDMEGLESFDFHLGNIDDKTLAGLLKNGNLTRLTCEEFGKLDSATIELLANQRTKKWDAAH